MTLNWPIIMLCAVGISILLTSVLIPQILHVSLAKRLFDRPAQRKIHHGVVPRLGGFAFLPVLLVTAGIVLVMPANYVENSSIVMSPDFIRCLPDIIVLVAAMMIMFLTGLYDDLLSLKYGVKFLSQLIAAVLLVEAGEYIVDYDHLFGIGTTTVAMGKIITGFLIVYIVNALNLIDGIDGLASGLCVVTLCFFGWMLFAAHLFMFSLLSWVGAASMAVFWVFNVFGSKRRHTKIFMGDVGSLSVGIFVAFLAITVARQNPGESLWAEPPFLLAMSPLVLPLFDVVRVFCVRIINHKSPFLPDKRHIHHLMLDTGISMRGAMCLLILGQICVLALNLWLAEYWSINWILILDAGIYILWVLAVSLSSKDKPKKANKKAKRIR